MTTLHKHLVKHLLICTSIALSAVLLSACGSQESANFDRNTDKNIDATGVNIASAAPNIVANTDVITPPKQESKLLTSLAANYPNGQLPTERAAQAALDLVQNPAALKQTMKQTAPIQPQSGSIQAQSGLIQPQAFAVPRVTSTDYLPVQRIQNTTLYGAYFFSIYAGEVTSALAGNPNWRLEGPAFWASLVTGVELNPVHRFQNKLNGSYLYTIYDGERANIVANYSATFNYEGVAWYARQTPAAGWSTLYRFRNLTNGTYLFTANEVEKNTIVADYAAVFLLEGPAYYVRQDAPSAAVVNPIAVGATHTCALKSDSTVNCWGGGYFGQLGDGTGADRLTPTAVPGLTGVVSLAAGSYHACALKSDGTVRCWGANPYGNLGDGTQTDRYSPTAVPGLTDVVSLVTGSGHTCAAKNDGSVYCWGYNAENGVGSLGTGNSTASQVISPTLVPGLTGVVSLAAGCYHTCAVKSDGTVRCWGRNNDGQLGDGTKVGRNTPTAITGLAGVVSMSAGQFHTCALKSNTKVTCWGNNSWGQLGDLTTTERLSPGADLNLLNIFSISAGSTFTCALYAGGSLRCWGNNAEGQAGTGLLASNYTAPVPVAGLNSGVIAISAGNYDSCVLKSDGSARCWGRNDEGQLGDGTITTKLTSVPVLGGAVYWK